VYGDPAPEMPWHLWLFRAKETGRFDARAALRAPDLSEAATAALLRHAYPYRPVLVIPDG
jgi:hypothetical protein